LNLVKPSNTNFTFTSLELRNTFKFVLTGSFVHIRKMVSTLTVKLNNGYEMPIVGLGTSHTKSCAGEVKQAVKDAIEGGYRHIDCALAYQNEHEVGEAIKEKIADGTVSRKDLFVTSKLWNTYHSFSKVEEGIRLSLKNLDLEYLDLYLIHWPMGYQENTVLFPKDDNGKFIYHDADYLETWKGMEHCVNLGLTKSIGVSNFNIDQLKKIIDNSSVKPVTNQVISVYFKIGS